MSFDFRIVRNKAAENAKQSPGHTSPSLDTGSPPLSHQPSPNSEIQRAPYTITGILGIPQSQTAQTMVDPNGNKRKREDQGEIPQSSQCDTQHTRRQHPKEPKSLIFTVRI